MGLNVVALCFSYKICIYILSTNCTDDTESLDSHCLFKSFKPHPKRRAIGEFFFSWQKN